MMGLRFMGDVPFHEVYIHGLVRDADGQKMSKSKGNILDPIDLIDGIDLDSLVEKRTSGLMQTHMRETIEKATRRQFPDGIPAHGTDALRFTFAALATTGRDIRFDLGRIQGYRDFCNKLWNAARFVLMNTQDQDCQQHDEAEFSDADRWIRSRLQSVIEAVHGHFAAYRLDLAAQALYDFAWHEYCDWYLELAKAVLQNDAADDTAKACTRFTLVTVLENIMRLLHPIMPFVTEEIWQKIAPLANIDGASVMLAPYPTADEDLHDGAAEAELAWLMEFILGIRRIRGEMDIAPGKRLPVLLQHASNQDAARAERHRVAINQLARIESLTVLAEEEEAPQCATALLGDMKILVPMAGLIDQVAEMERLQRQLDKVSNEIRRAEGKLANQAFVKNAPEAVVNQERQRLSDFQGTAERLHEQLARIRAMD